MSLDKAYTAITNCFSYKSNELFDAIKMACDNADFPNVKNKIVLLKPNVLSDAKPENSITTNPEFLRQVIKYIKQKQPSKIIVGDSPGLPGTNFLPKNCGIFDVCLEENVEWVDFGSNYELEQIPGCSTSLNITSYYKKADIIISLPKFKTHEFMYLTGAIKNLFGLIPGLHKSSCHLSCPSRESFAHLIGGICELVSPNFAIMDSVIGMDGPGPANGYPKPISLILASNNCAALDIAQSLLAGVDPEKLPIIQDIEKRNLIPKNLIYTLGTPSEYKIQNFKAVQITNKTKFFKSLIFPFFTRGIQKFIQQREAPPQFLSEKCILCGKCVKICPAKALSIKQKRVDIDTSKCIRCYCCNEVCPENAIKIFRKRKTNAS